MNITETIIQMNAEFLQTGRYFILPEEGDKDPDPEDINNGYQSQYAQQLADTLKQHGVLSVVHDITICETPHCCVEVEGRFYDSQAPKGVECLHQLPIFASMGAHEKSPQLLTSSLTHMPNSKEKMPSFTRIKI